MVSAGSERYAVIVLVRDPGEAARLETLIREIKRENGEDGEDCEDGENGGDLRVLCPEIRGLRFFAADSPGDGGHLPGERSGPGHAACDVDADLNRWWARNVPRDATPVYLIDHEPSLAEWLGGLDGHFYVSIPDPAVAAEYRALATVTTFVADDRIAGFAERLPLGAGGRDVIPRVPVPAEEERGSEQLFRPAKPRLRRTGRGAFRRASLGSDELGSPHDRPGAGEGGEPSPEEEIIGILASTLQKLERLRLSTQQAWLRSK